MRTVTDAFDECRQRLELTDTESKDAQRRHKEVRQVIRDSFEVDRDFLSGSYGRHTKTKPLKDVDIFFVLGTKERKKYRDGTPSAMLDAFEACLVKEYGRDKVERGRRCVTVEFEKRLQTDHEDGKVLSIDAVPAFEVDGHFDIPDGVIGKWVQTDPEVHAVKAKDKNKAFGECWKPLVKMLKGWNREAGKPIKPSFLVEVMALQLSDAPFVSYPSEISGFFAAARENMDKGWPDPAGLGPPVSDQMDLAARTEAKRVLRSAELLAARARNAETNGQHGEAIALWRQLLGRYFPTR